MPTTGDEFGNRDPVRGDGRLREKTQALGDLLRLHLLYVVPVEQHCALRRRQEPRECSQQGRLAAGIGADDDRELSVRNAHIEITDDLTLVIGQIEVLGDQR